MNERHGERVPSSFGADLRADGSEQVVDVGLDEGVAHDARVVQLHTHNQHHHRDGPQQLNMATPSCRISAP